MMMARRFYRRGYGRLTKVYNIRRGYRRGFRRGRSSGMRFITNPVYWGGVAVGAFTQLDDRHAELIRAVATCPIRGGSGIGMIKSAAQGAVFGEAVSSLAGMNAKTEAVGGQVISRIRSAF